jgi:uncharacterized protein
MKTEEQTVDIDTTEAVVFGIQYNKAAVNNLYSLFKCDRCGKCCHDCGTGIALMPGEVQKLASKLGITPSQFRNKYTFTDGRTRLMSFPCTFYKEGIGCTAYEDRPITCKIYPIIGPAMYDGDYLLQMDTKCAAAKNSAKKFLQIVKDLNDKAR